MNHIIPITIQDTDGKVVVHSYSYSIKVVKNRKNTLELRVSLGMRADGKQNQKSFYGHSEKEAKAKAAEYLQKTYGYNPPNAMTVREYLEDYISEFQYEWTDSTHESYLTILKIHIAPEIGNVSLTALTKKMCIEFRKRLQEKVSMNAPKDNERYITTKTVDNIISFLHSALDYAVETDQIPINPCPKNKRKKTKPAKTGIIEYLPARLFGDFYEAIKRDSYCHFFLLLLLTGMRLSEAFGLCENDLDNLFFTVSHQLQRLKNMNLLKKFRYPIVSDKNITIRKIVKRIVYVLRPTKGKNLRSIDYTPFCKQLLEEAKEHMENIPMAHRNTARLLFVNDDGTHYCKPTVSSHLKKCLAAYKETTGVDLTFATLKTLRHTYATWINDSGGDTRSLARTLGHNSPRTTEKYYIHETSEARKAYNGHALIIDDMICRKACEIDSNTGLDDSDEDFESYPEDDE